MVSRDSAVHATPRENTNDVISIDANHSTIVKFESNACQPYLTLSAKIVNLVETAASVTGRRFVCPNKGLTIRPSYRVRNHSLTNV